ncbi:hypothetical protein [Segniliparus rugosus]|uniref:Uncharacterized protein n=1 Tax=Segniliparus rugosus (strain ATCC BAA-974 / DSM 45345 / CCUG 50838 / CIP 108380 / JCM 13579 / CDC 945) TaxID=679197 RepID=E5XV20_SEGRC|nr:hypothetical protein [Segniliparus rugosus]EFV11856.1 hypothetical protein HMPREF9336_03342 [Segniliparus rugosus ATCC BAA-974]
MVDVVYFTDKIEKCQAIAGDVKSVKEQYEAFHIAAKGIETDLKSLAQTGKAPDLRDPMSILEAAGDNVLKALKWCDEHIDVFHNVMDWLTGDQGKITSAANHWQSGVPGKLNDASHFAWDPKKAINDAWQGNLADSVANLIGAEKVIVDLLSDLCKACGMIFTAIGKMLDKLRELVLKEVADLLIWLLEKLGKLILNSGLGGFFGGVITCAASIYDAVKKGVEVYRLVEDIKNNYEDASRALSGMFNAGKKLAEDVKGLV